MCLLDVLRAYATLLEEEIVISKLCNIKKERGKTLKKIYHNAEDETKRVTMLYGFRSGTKWAHVSCALWIPEVSIGVPEKMEPICKISSIPVSCCGLHDTAVCHSVLLLSYGRRHVHLLRGWKNGVFRWILSELQGAKV